jgi:hypothetical protein
MLVEDQCKLSNVTHAVLKLVVFLTIRAKPKSLVCGRESNILNLFIGLVIRITFIFAQIFTKISELATTKRPQQKMILRWATVLGPLQVRAA